MAKIRNNLGGGQSRGKSKKQKKWFLSNTIEWSTFPEPLVMTIQTIKQQ
jgi:hypothetical protein